MRSAGPEFAAMRVASDIASSSRRSWGITRETRPQASAACASSTSPVRHISAARDAPRMRGSSQAAPIAGTMPRRTKLAAKRARSEAMRMSHRQARSHPPPIAAPLTAAIVGTCSACRARLSG